jgi:hypothetical protein
MAFEAVDAGGGEMFPQHPKVGEFETLKGKMLTPPLIAPIESVAEDNARPQSDAMPSSPWTSEVLVTTGMTRGGGTMAH